MILLIDAGNTAIKWRLLSAPGADFGGPPDTGDVAQLGRFMERTAPDRVVVASVRAHTFADRLNCLCRSLGAAPPEYLDSTVASAGIRVVYPEPDRLGVDRYLAMVAAHCDVPGNLVVIGCGTATTFDAVAQDGAHLGGVIVPGRTSMMRCLAQSTDLLPLVEDGQGVLFADNTEDAIRAGTRLALAAAVDRIASDMAACMTGDATRILTGGGADELIPLLKERFRVMPELVFRGMSIVLGTGWKGR